MLGIGSPPDGVSPGFWGYVVLESMMVFAGLAMFVVPCRTKESISKSYSPRGIRWLKIAIIVGLLLVAILAVVDLVQGRLLPYPFFQPSHL